jgi:hypothetical protein
VGRRIVDLGERMDLLLRLEENDNTNYHYRVSAHECGSWPFGLIIASAIAMGAWGGNVGRRQPRAEKRSRR